MASPSPRSPAQVSKHLVQLPVTPPGRNYTVSHVASSLSTSRSTFSRGLNPGVSPRALVTNEELSGSQGPVTMQTRIAVRDATPHRFQVIPLREAKNRNNLPESYAVGAKDLKCRTRVSQSTDWKPVPIPSFLPPSDPRSNSSSLFGGRSNRSPNKPHILSVAEEVEVQGEEDASENTEFQLPLAPRDASKAVYPQNQRRQVPFRLGKPLHTLSTGPISSIKAHNKQLAPEAAWRASADRYTCHVISNKAKSRACSEDLTRRQNKVPRNCVYERPFPLCSQDDSSWDATKRHAIYSDTLVLPLFSPEHDFVGPQQISMAPTPPYSQGPVGHSCRHCTKPRHIEDVFGPRENVLPSSKIITSSQSEQNFTPRKFSAQTRPLTEPPLCPSVPRLRLSRKAQGSSTFRANVKLTLNVVHEQPLKHPKIILDLLLQLGQAIEEWNNIRSEHSRGLKYLGQLVAK